MNVVSTSHGTLVSVVVGGREARIGPSLGEWSRVLRASKRMPEPYPNAPVGANSADGALTGAVVLPYTLSSQSSTITSFVTLGKRANSRIVYLSSRADSILGNKQPAFASRRLEVSGSIMYFYNSLHPVIG